MNKKILILAPHIDDAEIGCGGFMASTHFRMSAWKVELIFSDAEQSTREAGHTVETLIKEHERAICVLMENQPLPLTVFSCDPSFLVRSFTTQRQGILDRMIMAKKNSGPFDVVLLPGTGDCHQDHQVIHDEGIRAFKDCSILGYEIPHNYPEKPFNANYFVTLSEDAMNRKIRALECFKTQAHRQAHISPESMEALARFRGSQIGVRYAEAYEVIRWVE